MAAVIAHSIKSNPASIRKYPIRRRNSFDFIGVAIVIRIVSFDKICPRISMENPIKCPPAKFQPICGFVKGFKLENNSLLQLSIFELGLVNIPDFRSFFSLCLLFRNCNLGTISDFLGEFLWRFCRPISAHPWRLVSCWLPEFSSGHKYP